MSHTIESLNEALNVELVKEAKYGKFDSEIDKAIFACKSALKELPRGVSDRGKIEDCIKQLARAKSEVKGAKQLKESIIEEAKYSIPKDSGWKSAKSDLSDQIDETFESLDRIAAKQSIDDDKQKKEMATLRKKLDDVYTAFDKVFNQIP